MRPVPSGHKSRGVPDFVVLGKSPGTDHSLPDRPRLRHRSSVPPATLLRSRNGTARCILPGSDSGWSPAVRPARQCPRSGVPPRGPAVPARECVPPRPDRPGCDRSGWTRCPKEGCRTGPKAPDPGHTPLVRARAELPKGPWSRPAERKVCRQSHLLHPIRALPLHFPWQGSPEQLPAHPYLRRTAGSSQLRC